MRPRESLLAPHVMTRKGNPKGMSEQTRNPETPAGERRNNDDRRSDNRRAHDRFTPGKVRSDRRQGERRRDRSLVSN